MIVNNTRVLPGLSRRQAARLVRRFLAGEDFETLAAAYHVPYEVATHAVRLTQYPKVRAALKLG